MENRLWKVQEKMISMPLLARNMIHKKGKLCKEKKKQCQIEHINNPCEKEQVMPVQKNVSELFKFPQDVFKGQKYVHVGRLCPVLRTRAGREVGGKGP